MSGGAREVHVHAATGEGGLRLAYMMHNVR